MGLKLARCSHHFLVIKEGRSGSESFNREVNFHFTSTSTLPRLIKRGLTAHSCVQYTNINLRVSWMDTLWSPILLLPATFFDFSSLGVLCPARRNTQRLYLTTIEFDGVIVLYAVQILDSKSSNLDGRRPMMVL